MSYRRDTEEAATWTAHISVGNEERRAVATDLSLPNHFVIAVELQGDDVWIGTGHGLARGVGKGFFEGLSKVDEVAREPAEHRVRGRTDEVAREEAGQ